MIQDVGRAAGAQAAFADVRTEEISVASAEDSEEERGGRRRVHVKVYLREIHRERRRRVLLPRGRAGGPVVPPP